MYKCVISRTDNNSSLATYRNHLKPMRTLSAILFLLYLFLEVSHAAGENTAPGKIYYCNPLFRNVSHNGKFQLLEVLNWPEDIPHLAEEDWVLVMPQNSTYRIVAKVVGENAAVLTGAHFGDQNSIMLDEIERLPSSAGNIYSDFTTQVFRGERKISNTDGTFYIIKYLLLKRGNQAIVLERQQRAKMVSPINDSMFFELNAGRGQPNYRFQFDETSYYLSVFGCDAEGDDPDFWRKDYSVRQISRLLKTAHHGLKEYYLRFSSLTVPSFSIPNLRGVLKVIDLYDEKGNALFLHRIENPEITVSVALIFARVFTFFVTRGAPLRTSSISLPFDWGSSSITLNLQQLGITHDEASDFFQQSEQYQADLCNRAARSSDTQLRETYWKGFCAALSKMDFLIFVQSGGI